MILWLNEVNAHDHGKAAWLIPQGPVEIIRAEELRGGEVHIWYRLVPQVAAEVLAAYARQNADLHRDNTHLRDMVGLNVAGLAAVIDALLSDGALSGVLPGDVLDDEDRKAAIERWLRP